MSTAKTGGGSQNRGVVPKFDCGGVIFIANGITFYDKILLFFCVTGAPFMTNFLCVSLHREGTTLCQRDVIVMSLGCHFNCNGIAFLLHWNDIFIASE